MNNIESAANAGGMGGAQPSPESVLRDKIAADIENGEAGATTPAASEYLRLLASCRVDASEPIEKDDWLFQWEGTAFMPRQNVVSLKAPAKTGKTFALTAFAAAFLTGYYQGIRSLAQPSESVLFVDTEQARNSSRKVLRRILAHAPGSESRLHVVNVRNMLADDRLGIIEAAVEQWRPALIIVDGIADLIPGMDYNDQSAAEAVIAGLASTAEQRNAVVVCAIHTNKNDSHATGWLGRLLLQKSTLEIAMTRKHGEDARTMEFTARDREVKPIQMAIEDTPDGLGRLKIISSEERDRKRHEEARERYRQDMLEIGIEPPQSMPKTEFVTLYQTKRSVAEGKQCSRNTACNFINRCIECGLLFQLGEKYVFES